MKRRTSAHAAGRSEEEGQSASDEGFGVEAKAPANRSRLGWWDDMIGPGITIEARSIRKNIAVRCVQLISVRGSCVDAVRVADDYVAAGCILLNSRITGASLARRGFVLALAYCQVAAAKR